MNNSKLVADLAKINADLNRDLPLRDELAGVVPHEMHETSDLALQIAEALGTAVGILFAAHCVVHAAANSNDAQVARWKRVMAGVSWLAGREPPPPISRNDDPAMPTKREIRIACEKFTGLHGDMAPYIAASNAFVAIANGNDGGAEAWCDVVLNVLELQGHMPDLSCVAGAA
jgi:hypothetical protein